MKAMRIVIAMISAAAVTAAAFGQASSAPARAPVSASSARRVVTGTATGAATGAMERLIVILKPAGGAPPDIASLGGSVEFRLPDRMIVTVPATAVAAIEQSPSVAYVQRSLRAGEQPGLAAPPILSRTPHESRARVPQTGGATWKTGTYLYDGAGNISDIGTGNEPNSDGLTNTYRYDKVGRLVTGTANYAVGNYNEVYGYDPFGNMTSRTTNKPVGPPEVVAPTIDPATNHIGSDPNRYDPAGNEVADPSASTRHFDSLNMMTHKQTSVTDDYYIYTPDDQRIGVLNAKAPSTWTWSLRDEGGSLIRQYGSSETTPGADWLWIEDYVYAGDRPLGAERVAAQGGRRHFHLDHLGTPRLITGLNGVLIARHDYLPFGREVTPGTELIAGSDRAEPKRFTGHERDSAETDPPATLDYMHARYFSPMLARFTSVDPALDTEKVSQEPQRWNRYAYVLNNPLRSTDPTGTDAIAITDYNGARTRLFGHTSWLFQDSKQNWYEHQMGTDDNALRATFGLAKAQATLQQVGGSDLTSADMAALYRQRYGDDTAILKTTSEEDGKIFAAAQDSVKSFNSGEHNYSLLTNNCGQAGVDILHKAGFTGAPSAVIPSILSLAISEWFEKVNQKLIRQTEPLLDGIEK